MNEGAAARWQEVVEKHHAALLDELPGVIDASTRAAVAEAERSARDEAGVTAQAALESVSRTTKQTVAEHLNQQLRRLREETSKESALQCLAEASAPYAHKAVVLLLESGQARSLSTRNLQGTAFAFDLSEAAAVNAAVETRDPVVALASGREISEALSRGFAVQAQEKTYLFPIVVRPSNAEPKAAAVLVAAGEVTAAALELLSEAAGMRLDALSVPVSKPDLVQLAAAPAVPKPQTAWDQLDPAAQKLHLAAQRFARVQVAEMRLYRSDAVRKGQSESNIHAALQPEITRARDQYQQRFVAGSPTMVDYLHLEILRSLAHDDDRLLGPEYPGPLA